MRGLTGLFATALAGLLAACATTPQAEVYDVTPSDVLRNVKCELRTAYRDNADVAGDWLSALQISMKVYNSGDAGGGISFIVPTNPGTFSAGLSSRLSGYGSRTERIYFSESMQRLEQPVYDTICDDALYYRGKKVMLVGRIGFAELFERMRDTIEMTNTDISQLDYNLHFEIAMSGNASARISSLSIGDDGLFGADIFAGAEKANHHSLQVTFYPPKENYCPVALVNGVCPRLVYQVNRHTVQIGRRGRAAQAPSQPAPRPTRSTGAPSREELNRALDRNTTSTIVDNLRDQNLLD